MGRLYLFFFFLLKNWIGGMPNKNLFGVAEFIISLKFLDISWWRPRPTIFRDHKAVHYHPSHLACKDAIYWGLGNISESNMFPIICIRFRKIFWIWLSCKYCNCFVLSLLCSTMQCFTGSVFRVIGYLTLWI